MSVFAGVRLLVRRSYYTGTDFFGMRLQPVVKYDVGKSFLNEKSSLES